MNKIILVAVFIFSAAFAYAGDLIQKKSGERIYCKIDSVDTASLYITYSNNGKDKARLTIDKQEVEFFEYDYREEQKSEIKTHSEMKNSSDPASICSLGAFQGSSLVVGAGMEWKLCDYIGAQAGLGVFSADCGINFHFTPTIRSSCISLQTHYEWFFGHQSVSVVPTFILRLNNGLTGQLGYRQVIYGYSPSQDRLPNTTLGYIYASFGWYFPYDLRKLLQPVAL